MQSCLQQQERIQTDGCGGSTCVCADSNGEVDEPPALKSNCSGGVVSSPTCELAKSSPPTNVAAPHAISAERNPYYCLHPNMRMRKNHLGKGLYAIAPIRKGEVIYNAAGSTTLYRVDSKTMMTWPPEQFDFYEKFSWQVGHDLWAGPMSKEDVRNDFVNYLNHSCEPTAWFTGEEVLVARRDINVEEEITFDYATSETAISTFLVKGCLCGSATCRKRVSPWDYRLPSLQSAYGQHFMPYILEQISIEPKLEFGTGMYSTLHQHVELRKSECGGYKNCGLFATKLIPKGTIVWCGENDNDEVVSIEEFENFSKDKKEWFLNFSFQVDKDTLSSVRSLEDLENDASHFMNHSCDPTVWFIGDKLLEARRDIQPGEEITYDYATCDSLIERITECKCGSVECRGKVSITDFLRPDLQDRYKHHFSLHLLGEIYNTQTKGAADMVEDYIH